MDSRTQGRSTLYWLVQVSVLRFIPKPCVLAFQKYIVLCIQNVRQTLCLAPVEGSHTKASISGGKVAGHFLIENLTVGPYMEVTLSQSAMPGDTKYLLQPGYHLPDLSSLSFSAFWLFAYLHNLVIGLLSSHFNNVNTPSWGLIFSRTATKGCDAMQGVTYFSVMISNFFSQSRFMKSWSQF